MHLVTTLSVHTHNGLELTFFLGGGGIACWESITAVRTFAFATVGGPRFCTLNTVHNSKLKVKDSRNRPGVAQRVPGGLGSQISMTFGTWRWWSQPHTLAVFTPRNLPGTHRGWVDPRAMVRWEGNMSLKNPVTPPGFDPGTLRLVAQCLNHYATPGPCIIVVVPNTNKVLITLFFCGTTRISPPPPSNQTSLWNDWLVILQSNSLVLELWPTGQYSSAVVRCFPFASSHCACFYTQEYHNQMKFHLSKFHYLLEHSYGAF